MRGGVVRTRSGRPWRPVKRGGARSPFPAPPLPRSAALPRSSEVSCAPCGAATPSPNPPPGPPRPQGWSETPRPRPSALPGWPGARQDPPVPRCVAPLARPPCFLKELLHAEIQPGSWAADQNSPDVGVPGPGRVRIYRR